MSSQTGCSLKRYCFWWPTALCLKLKFYLSISLHLTLVSATSYQALYSALPNSRLALVSIDEIEVTLFYQQILSTNAEY